MRTCIALDNRTVFILKSLGLIDRRNGSVKKNKQGLSFSRIICGLVMERFFTRDMEAAYLKYLASLENAEMQEHKNNLFEIQRRLEVIQPIEVKTTQ